MATAPDRDLHRPADAHPRGVAVVLHPHPGMGGDRHHPLVVAVCEHLAERGVAALRLDLPNPDPVAEVPHLVAAATELAADEDVARIGLVGYSWGSIVAASAAPPGLVARVLIAPPAAMLAIDPREDELPTLVLVPAHDQYGPPDEVERLLGEHPGTTIEVVEGADHFLAGAVARIAGRAASWLAAQLAT
jgi:alpha/beta superfamily hydrolase